MSDLGDFIAEEAKKREARVLREKLIKERTLLRIRRTS